MKFKSILKKCIIPLLIIAAGILVMRIMIVFKTAPEKISPKSSGVLVETVPLKKTALFIYVNATGSVETSQEADITPRVSGNVVWASETLSRGGFFNKGDLLFRIDPVDYELAAEKSRAQVAKAEYELEDIESKAKVARMEWKRIRMENKNEPSALVLYEPQLKNAKAQLAAAKADLKQRLIDIGRTEVRAPFSCRVRSENIAPGQYVKAGVSAGVLTDIRSADIIVSLPLHELKWIRIPQRMDGGPEPDASVRIDVGTSEYRWPATVQRTLGDVDPKGRMMRVLLRVEDPFNVKGLYGNTQPDLADGMFVDVEIRGRRLADVFAVPPRALHEGDTVWIMADNDLLEIRSVDVVRKEKDRTIVQGNLHEGERLVITQISGVAEGLELRIGEEAK